MDSCGGDGYDQTTYARGLCERHYRQQLRHGAVRLDRPPAVCAVEGCEREAVTRGWCHGHYLRVVRTGGIGADRPLRRPERLACSVDGCDAAAHAQGLCQTHYRRSLTHGDADDDRPVRTPPGVGGLSHGYRKVPVPEHERHLVGGANSVGEHRLVMARLLGRPLAADESVHHRNGDRLDNAADNLELWSRYQPSGQRVVDKLADALRWLDRYEPDLRHALGLDLDPATGRPMGG